MLLEPVNHQLNCSRDAPGFRNDAAAANSQHEEISQVLWVFYVYI
jgi:hypothetical protein